MTPSYALHVETQGGVTDLGRVVDILALYDLTPLDMSVRRSGDGLHIDLNLQGDARTCTLCVSRLAARVEVTTIELSPQTS